MPTTLNTPTASMSNILPKLNSRTMGNQGELKRMQPFHPVSEDLRLLASQDRKIPPYFWSEDSQWDTSKPAVHRGYTKARHFAGKGTLEDIARLGKQALETVQQLFSLIDNGTDSETNLSLDKEEIMSKGLGIVEIRLSDELLDWKLDQQREGRILPGKGKGLRRVSDDVVKLLGAEQWPDPMLTSNVFFGTGWLNLMVGAYDSQTLYSNYCNDLGFYYEHGFDKIFPEFEPIILESAYDPVARCTPLGELRREAVQLGLNYIRGKVNLEVKHKAKLLRKSAKMNRDAAHVVSFYESSLTGMVAEIMGRGFDPAASFDDTVSSSPGTDIIDVGSDINNSEIMNSVLNTANITDTGVITENALQRVYDAYGAIMGRMFTERWAEPLVNMNSLLYMWHILNDRHHFLRRIVLGYCKVREAGSRPLQREADLDEVFDERFHTTGFSRPLVGACDGNDTCSDVARFLVQVADQNQEKKSLLSRLWVDLVENPLTYARNGIIDSAREESIIQSLSLSLATCYHHGFILEQRWLIAHAAHHSWQVNYLMEAAMFGSLLDDGSLAGKLDRAD